ncbi:MAG: pyruvate dehydrogenase (acetyl-transferring) E1 component subunit alpha [Saprospiraceae bacterium]|nr:pyruvate dehydrogenase (acetyl-transferring) E1 component subunit alpha [Saprospiraceae bacterium]
MGKVAEKIKTKYSKEIYLQWYDIMLLIRRFEERTLMAYGQNKVRGFCHVYIGQEAIAAGLVSAIGPEDSIVTAYRQHGIGLSRGLSPNACMAELFGKSTGVVKGKGGSMHFFSKAKKYFGGNGIVGAQIPIGTGIAFAEKYNGTENLCVTMFGDGAARQGALYESFNMAKTWDLPVLYICENNQYAMGTSVERTSNITDIYRVGAAFDMPSEPVNAMDPVNVHEALSRATEYIRKGKGPYFLEMKTYRYKGHSVSDPARYRSKDELKQFQDQDPIKSLERTILENEIASQDELQQIKESVKEKIKEAVEFAEKSPFPDPSELYTDNYVQKDFPFTT